MKARLKTKNTKKLVASRRFRPATRAVAFVNVKYTGLRHFRLAEHKHTGKLIHHRHTSHLALIVILIIVGFFLLISNNVVRAQSDSESVLINAIVPGLAPAIVTEESKTSTTITDNAMSNITWFLKPVPLYILAVAITLGFWSGDLFDRRFGARRYGRRSRRTA